MTGITAREIMDTAMTLEEGEKIVTRCNSYEEMEALRTQLYKIRKSMLKSHRTLAYTLYVSREVIPDAKEDNYLVIVTKELTVSNVAIVTKDGSAKPFTRVESAGVDEVVRMAELMRQDGISEEEIETALAEKGEQDFNAAADKIEEAQAAESKKKK